MRQTFATDAGGAQLSEFATPLRAQQAFNKNQGVGEFEPAQGPALRLLAERRPDLQAQANLVTEAGFQKTLNERLLKEYGVEDKEKGLILPPAIQRLTLGHRPQSKEEVESILQQIAPEGGKIKGTNLWNDPKTGMAMRRQLLATTTDPAEQKRIKEEVVTPETLEWFEGRRTGRRTGQPGAPAAATPPPVATPEVTGSAVSGLGRLPSLRELGVTLSRQFVEEEEENPRLRTP
jgi:hypothetical protein